MRSLLLGVCLLPAAALGADILGARYDPAGDALVVDIAYRGTHPSHDFRLQWGPCRSNGEAAPQAIAARLVDRHGEDPARQPYRVRERFPLGALTCRPAQVTLRLGRVSQALVNVPPPAAPAADAAAEWKNMQASALLGRTVISPEGEALGEVRELLVDLAAGRVGYAVLALRTGGTLRAPVDALSAGEKADQVVLHAGAAAGGGTAPAAGKLVAARALIGRPVEDRRGEAAGRIEDLIVNLHSGEVRRVRLELGGRDRLVPVHRLRDTPPGEPLVLLEQP